MAILGKYKWKRFLRTNSRWSGWHLCNKKNECKCGWVYLENEYTKTEIIDYEPNFFVCINCLNSNIHLH